MAYIPTLVCSDLSTLDRWGSPYVQESMNTNLTSVPERQTNMGQNTLTSLPITDLRVAVLKQQNFTNELEQDITEQESSTDWFVVSMVWTWGTLPPAHTQSHDIWSAGHPMDWEIWWWRSSGNTATLSCFQIPKTPTAGVQTRPFLLPPRLPGHASSLWGWVGAAPYPIYTAGWGPTSHALGTGSESLARPNPQIHQAQPIQPAGEKDWAPLV